MLARLKPARGARPMRSDLLSVLAKRAGTAMERHFVTLPWLSCAPRTQSNGWPLSVSLESRPCAVLKTDSDKEQQNSLTAGLFCGVMKAPKNRTRLHKGLSESPIFGRTLVAAFAVFTGQLSGQVSAHIGQVCNVRGPVRARRSRSDRGALQACPFLFSQTERGLPCLTS